MDLASHPGATIYREQCLECHGDKGQGVEDKYDDALVGNRSIDSLTRRIERTMPEDEAELCVGEDARAVSEYIYHAFYSPAARGDLTPPSLDLSRLTVPQYRTSVADLVGRFRSWSVKTPEGERGLNANYSGRPDYKKVDDKGKKVQPPKDQKFQRVDARVQFDFKDKSPAPEKFAAEKFQVSWTGSVFVEETGDYEFVVRTQNGARLWVNDLRTGDESTNYLIDAWVSSGPEVRDEKGRLFLIGGRAYPIRLDFFTYKEPTASIELLWKPPHGVLETIPARVLSPSRPQEVFVSATPFPADDRSYGYERGNAVSESWFTAVLQGSIEAADHIMERIDQLARTKADAPDRTEKLRQFCLLFAETAFRRPLSDEDRRQFVDSLFQSSATPEKAVKRCVLAVLQSPRFLYPVMPDADTKDAWSTASKLALILWDSLPDNVLTNAARRCACSRTREPRPRCAASFTNGSNSTGRTT
jgi:hypothetical protein